MRGADRREEGQPFAVRDGEGVEVGEERHDERLWEVTWMGPWWGGGSDGNEREETTVELPEVRR